MVSLIPLFENVDFIGIFGYSPCVSNGAFAGVPWRNGDIWRGRARVGYGLACQAKEPWLNMAVSGLGELQQRVHKEPYCCWTTEQAGGQADKTCLLVIKENDRHVFPHVKLFFPFIEIPDRGDKFVLAVYVFKAESIVRYREGDFGETVYKRKDGASTEASPEEIVSTGRGRKGFDSQLTGIRFEERDYSQFMSLASEFRKDHRAPEYNDLISEEVISDLEEVTFGFSLFADSCADSRAFLVIVKLRSAYFSDAK